MNTAIRIVVFDLGGVLVRICRSWEEACVRAGIGVRSMDRFRAPDLAAERHRLHSMHQIGGIECDGYFQAIAAATGGLYSPEEVSRIHLAWTGDDYEGVSGVIESLRLAGIRTACLSNTNASHWRTLTLGSGKQPASAALAALDDRLASHLLRAAKPEQAIYERAECMLGFGPGEALFFDDTPENVAAAASRGWHACLIDHSADTAAQMVSHLTKHGIRAAAR